MKTIFELTNIIKCSNCITYHELATNVLVEQIKYQAGLINILMLPIRNFSCKFKAKQNLLLKIFRFYSSPVAAEFRNEIDDS